MAKKKDNKKLIKEALAKITKQKILVKGKKQSLKKFVREDDLWVQSGSKKQGVIISHEAVERLAKVAKIQIADVKLVISPTASNEQQHVFLMTPSALNGNTIFPQIGEASIRNTGGVSRRYLATMAYKRGFDRCILRALGIEGVYSQSEADEFIAEEVASDVSNQELAGLQVELATINKATNKADLLGVMESASKKELTSSQKAYLTKVFAKKYSEIALGENEG